jgi:hypothetical protein
MLNSHVDFDGAREETGEKPSWHRRKQHIKQTRNLERGRETRGFRTVI